MNRVDSRSAEANSGPDLVATVRLGQNARVDAVATVALQGAQDGARQKPSSLGKRVTLIPAKGVGEFNPKELNRYLVDSAQITFSSAALKQEGDTESFGRVYDLPQHQKKLDEKLAEIKHWLGLGERPDMNKVGVNYSTDHHFITVFGKDIKNYDLKNPEDIERLLESRGLASDSEAVERVQKELFRLQTELQGLLKEDIGIFDYQALPLSTNLMGSWNPASYHHWSAEQAKKRLIKAGEETSGLLENANTQVVGFVLQHLDLSPQQVAQTFLEQWQRGKVLTDKEKQFAAQVGMLTAYHKDQEMSRLDAIRISQQLQQGILGSDSPRSIFVKPEGELQILREALKISEKAKTIIKEGE